MITKNERRLFFIAAVISFLLTVSGGVNSLFAQTIPGRGSIQVFSKPEGADIVINNVPVGKTPKNVENLKSGYYNFVLNKEGYKKRQKRVQIHEGINKGFNLLLYELKEEKLDLGLVHFASAPKNFPIQLPASFSKVEVGFYGQGEDTPNQYGGWNAWFKVNDRMVWKFMRYDNKKGGIIADFTRRKKRRWEKYGRDKLLDVTSFCRPGSNTFTYYHYTEGPGIGIVVKIHP